VLAAIGVDASKSDWLARGAASQDPDPIYAAIETHKAARATWEGWVYRHQDLALQLPFLWTSESIGNHDSKIMDACGVG
jgi:hypothetical protein